MTLPTVALTVIGMLLAATPVTSPDPVTPTVPAPQVAASVPAPGTVSFTPDYFDPDFDMRARGLRGVAVAVTTGTDGSIYAAGRWTVFNNEKRVVHAVVKVSPDGMPRWDFTREFNGEIWDMEALPDGRLVVGGMFTRFDGHDAHGYAVLTPDGALDTTVKPGVRSDSGYRVTDVSVNSAGLIGISAGTPLIVNGNTGTVTRLTNVTGDTVPASDWQYGSIVMNDDGSAFVYARQDRSGPLVLRRLLPDGRIDPGFPTYRPPSSLGPASTFPFMVARPGGEAVLVFHAGPSLSDAGQRVVRVTPNGVTSEQTVADAFPAAGMTTLTGLWFSPAGEPVLAGTSGTQPRTLVFLTTGGAVNETLTVPDNGHRINGQPKTVTRGVVRDIAYDTSGRIVFGGDFDMYDDTRSAGLGRIGHLASTVGFLARSAWPKRSMPKYLPTRERARLACVVSNCGHKSNSPHGYWAIDILGQRGDPIYPSGAGTVHVGARFTGCAAGKDNKAGTWVWVDHGRRVTSRYYHLDTLTVRDGQRVTPDTMLGTMGRSGAFTCTGNTASAGYLHYEVRRGGDRTSDRVRIGRLYGCDGTTAVPYPDRFGTRDWNALKPYVHWVRSDGTACIAP